MTEPFADASLEHPDNNAFDEHEDPDLSGEPVAVNQDTAVPDLTIADESEPPT